SGHVSERIRIAIEGVFHAVDRHVHGLAGPVDHVAIDVDRVPTQVDVDGAVSAEIAPQHQPVVGTVAAGEVDDPIVVQRLCIGTHVDHAVVAGADRAGVVEAVAVRAAGPQVDPAVGQVDPPAGPIVDAVVAVPEAGDVVVDDPGAAVAVGEEVVRGERDDGARDVAGVVDLVGTVAANHGDRDGRVGFDGAAVVQRGGAEQRFHLHGDRRGVVAGGDGAGVLDQHVAVGPCVDADRGAVRAGRAADRTAVGHRRAVVAVGKGADAHAVGALGGDV